MRAYDPAAWVPFFTAIIAAAAGAHRSIVRRGLDQPRPDTQGGQIPPQPGGGGFYWLAPAALLGTVGAAYNAWVLLVEIVR